MESPAEGHFKFDDFELDRTRRLLLKHGEPIALNSKTFDLLLALVENRGEVLTKDDLLDKVWTGQFVEEGNLKVQISILRKVFGETSNDQRFIVTVPGRGYSFVAELDETGNGEIVVESHSYSNIVVESTDNSTDQLQLPPAGSLIWRNRGLFIVFSVLIIAALGSFYWFYLRAPLIPAPIRSVAVMPFVNDSGNPDLEYLADGLTESLIGSLSQLRDLSVKARASVSRYKGTEIDPQKVGTELSVESILTGRLVQRGDELTLYIEFVEPSTGNVFWKGDYRRSIKDIAALDREVSRDVAARLKTRLSGEDTAKLDKYQTDNSEAYQLYLRGLSLGRTQPTLDRVLKGIDCFEQAVKLDPNYAVAYVEMAWSYMRLGASLGLMSPQETFPKAREALRKAISIDENLSLTHSALAMYYLQYEWNWPAAQREFERAIAIDPENAGAMFDYGGYYDSLGRFDDAIRVREEGKKLLPRAANPNASICYSQFYAGGYDQALECYRRVLEMNPKHPWSYMGIGRIYLSTGKYPEAIGDLAKGVELLERNPRAVAVLGYAYAKAGRQGDAEKILHELQTRAKTEYVSPHYFAMFYAGTGDRDKVFDYLNQAFAERHPHLIFLKVEPLFTDLRSDPRFDDLVTKVGIPR